MPRGTGPLGRVVLVGFMAAGKSTVGRSLAGLLGWTFVDFDEEIETRTGRSIPDIFREDGERAFRELEAALTAEVAAGRFVVLAPGGGWITQPDLTGLLPPDTLLVWLRVSPAEAVRRASAATTHRPLLAGPDPLGVAERLIAQREPVYALADLVIDVDGRTPEDIAAELAEVVRSAAAG